MRDNKSKRNIRRTGRTIWIIVLALLILLVLTLSLIGAFLSGLSSKDWNVIPLFDRSQREGLSTIRVEEAPELVIEDDQARWEVNTSVDLFKNAYTNERGEVTARSADGSKIIAPGTANAYEFSLKNTGNVSLDYIMRLDSVFALLKQELPMQVRLRSGSRWLLGGENAWERPGDLTGVIEAGTLAVNQYVTYTFEWQWPYESGVDDTLLGDLNDTLLGNAAVEQEVAFKLNIQVESTVTPGVVRDDFQGEERWNVRNRMIIQLLSGVSILLLTPLLLFLILLRPPVYFTGFLPAEGELRIGGKKDTLRPDGRFVFPKVYMGKHSITLGQLQCEIRLKRRRKVEGIAFEVKDDLLVISMNRSVRAIELYLLPTLTIRQDEWAAIDRKHNVTTPEGVKEPDENNENTTPGGLHISRKGKLEIEGLAEAK